MAQVTQRVSDVTGKPIPANFSVYHVVEETADGELLLHRADCADLTEVRRYCLAVTKELVSVDIDANFSAVWTAGLEAKAAAEPTK